MKDIFKVFIYVVILSLRSVYVTSAFFSTKSSKTLIIPSKNSSSISKSFFGNWSLPTTLRNFFVLKNSTSLSKTVDNNITVTHSKWKPTTYTTSPISKNGKYKGKVLISYINGIYHSEQDCIDLAEQIKKIFNIDVRAFYYPSTGSWLKDVLKIGASLFLKSKRNQIALQLSLHLKSILNEVGSNGRILHIAHSAGAVITYLAARYHLTTDERNQIDVITLGGGRSITRKYFNGRIVNYYSSNDPLVIVDNRAGILHRNRPKKNSNNKKTDPNIKSTTNRNNSKNNNYWFPSNWNWFIRTKLNNNNTETNTMTTSSALSTITTSDDELIEFDDSDNILITTTSGDTTATALSSDIATSNIPTSSSSSSTTFTTTRAAAMELLSSDKSSKKTSADVDADDESVNNNSYHRYHEMKDKKHNTSFVFIQGTVSSICLYLLLLLVVFYTHILLIIQIILN